MLCIVGMVVFLLLVELAITTILSFGTRMARNTKVENVSNRD